MVLWPYMDDDALMCSLYLSPNVLVDSQIYCTSQSNLSHLYQYIILFIVLDLCPLAIQVCS